MQCKVQNWLHLWSVPLANTWYMGTGTLFECLFYSITFERQPRWLHADCHMIGAVTNEPGVQAKGACSLE